MARSPQDLSTTFQKTSSFVGVQDGECRCHYLNLFEKMRDMIHWKLQAVEGVLLVMLMGGSVANQGVESR
jgi:hypothetical protein